MLARKTGASDVFSVHEVPVAYLASRLADAFCFGLSAGNARTSRGGMIVSVDAVGGAGGGIVNGPGVSAGRSGSRLLAALHAPFAMGCVGDGGRPSLLMYNTRREMHKSEILPHDVNARLLPFTNTKSISNRQKDFISMECARCGRERTVVSDSASVSQIVQSKG